jgi:hypothetical protein
MVEKFAVFASPPYICTYTEGKFIYLLVRGRSISTLTPNLSTHQTKVDQFLPYGNFFYPTSTFIFYSGARRVAGRYAAPNNTRTRRQIFHTLFGMNNMIITRARSKLYLSVRCLTAPFDFLLSTVPLHFFRWSFDYEPRVRGACSP